jgi:hypothetical protein
VVAVLLAFQHAQE